MQGEKMIYHIKIDGENAFRYVHEPSNYEIQWFSKKFSLVFKGTRETTTPHETHKDYLFETVKP